MTGQAFACLHLLRGDVLSPAAAAVRDGRFGRGENKRWPAPGDVRHPRTPHLVRCGAAVAGHTELRSAPAAMRMRSRSLAPSVKPQGVADVMLPGAHGNGRQPAAE